ncbi:unnamed protein product [Oreochromis niloticus]|nr:unnamed protein product [Mustela putorius furo]
MKCGLSLAAVVALLALLLSSSQAQEQDTQCNTTAKADIVLLLDGSWSIGRLNFKTIRSFIARLVSVFDIGPDRVQIGLVQYSDDPRTEWHLNAHPSKASLLEAIANLSYKEGSTMTGWALRYICNNNFNPSVGMREDSRKIGVLITDGKSQDEVYFKSKNLRDRGIKLYAIGIGNYDEYELKTIASDPDESHIYQVSNFQFLLDIVDNVTINLCNSVKASAPPLSGDAQCNTTAKADIVLLVDGSWSVGRLNFKTVRNFIARVVSVFDIGPESVQIGLTQYSSDPRTEWHLNAHPTKASLLHAIAKLPLKGGTTMTGLALNYMLENNFKPNVGMRGDSRKIGILITDGRSQDEVIRVSQKLRDSGIELYAVGIAHIDENELKSIASDPDESHVYSVTDFEFLPDIVNDLTINLYNSLKGSDDEPLEAPTNLVTSEVKQSSFRTTWTPPNGTMDQFRVTYSVAAGGPPKELLVEGSVTTVVLENLNPRTEYAISVYAVVGERSSEPLRGTETTRDG